MNEICCVCDKPIEGKIFLLGGRNYDEVHYRKVSGNHKKAFAPVFFMLGSLVFLIAAIYFVSVVFHKSTTELKIIVYILAVLPALLWLISFYRLDRLEPEPKSYVIGVYLLGFLVARAIGQPVIREFFEVQNWFDRSWFFTFAGSFLIIGFTQEFLKYAAVRYSVFSLPEFDEATDGIIYAAAAGLGYATALNLDDAMGISALTLGAGASRMAIHALAQASFAGITGYFLGRAKFENRGMFWLPAGLTLAALMNAAVTILLYRIGNLRTSASDAGLNHWYRLGTAAVIAAGIYLILFNWIRKRTASILENTR